MAACRICKQEFDTSEELYQHCDETKCGKYGTLDALLAHGEKKIIDANRIVI